MKVELLGRAWCHLCEEMAQGLRAAGIEFDEVDVDSDQRLEERYGEDVPVLLKDGAEVCRHRLTPEALAKLR
ncbi:MAG: glutaredoxin family protein [Betaproteobacteria bacterium]|nr:MAG: glutaredoxin family protein [Betaproteobacteria bacterium]